MTTNTESHRTNQEMLAEILSVRFPPGFYSGMSRSKLSYRLGFFAVQLGEITEPQSPNEIETAWSSWDFDTEAVLNGIDAALAGDSALIDATEREIQSRALRIISQDILPAQALAMSVLLFCDTGR